MSNAVSTLPPQRRSVLIETAAQYGMEAFAFEQTLRKTVVPGECTREEFTAFLLVAREYRLNPILREIYAFPKKGGGIQPIVGVDGWAKLINAHPAFDGMTFHDQTDKKGQLVAITCRMHRKDRSHPIEATEYLEECIRYGRDGNPLEIWAKWPRRMLRHKAMIQAARYAFGFSGIIEPDEYDRFGATPHGPEAYQAITAEAPQEIDAEATPAEPEAPDYNLAHMPPKQQAGILCKDERFQTFLRDRLFIGEATEDEAKAAVYAFCGISSRRELDENEQARARWAQLVADYEDWRAQEDAARRAGGR